MRLASPEVPADPLMHRPSEELGNVRAMAALGNGSLSLRQAEMEGMGISFGVGMRMPNTGP